MRSQQRLDSLIDNKGGLMRRYMARIVMAAAVLALLFSGNLARIYVESLWFGSLNFASVYWYRLWLQLALFVVFTLATLALLRGGFWLIERVLPLPELGNRMIEFEGRPMVISPQKVMGPIAWGVSIFFGIIYGLMMTSQWESFALFQNQPATASPDPIFGKPLGFYLFSFPVYHMLAVWLTQLSITVLIGAAVCAVFALPQGYKFVNGMSLERRAYAALSGALAAVLLVIAWRVYLVRFAYLLRDHQTFSGVNFTQAHYLLPGLLFVAVTLLIAAAIALYNAVSVRRLPLLVVAPVLPVAVYAIVLIVASYVSNFIVKPNELERETPYIQHNIAATRRAFNLHRIQPVNFPAEPTVAAFDLERNRHAIDNIRLWDWRALQDTLRQVQAIRTYYDFPDVDVDRYRIDGRMRQVMIAARELDFNKLPPSSRNWINERLIYTHGYGVTMNTVNEFTSGGLPSFVISNVPPESTAPELRVTRPEIYFGQQTDTDVYVMTKQQEFNYPVGKDNNYSTYTGTGGIVMGGGLRRLVLAWALGDLSKVPFSDDITPQSRVLMHRNIRERVSRIAPFLTYDSDPYMVIDEGGRLHWIIDAYTKAASYPYSRHHVVEREWVNYFRNSVKVAIDAYNGSVTFYVFEQDDPVIGAYRRIFPALFKDKSEMPAGLRAHVRYPELMLTTQADVYSLYHTQDTKTFFQREDVWTVARRGDASPGPQDSGGGAQTMEPYFVLTQLQGVQTPRAERNAVGGGAAGAGGTAAAGGATRAGGDVAMRDELVLILPFTPSNRNNMIGWMAGRSDGDAYGSLVVYDFPKTRVVDGPVQIEAQIDQDAHLAAQFTLWSQQGSRVLRGNLLVLPLGRGLLYVEPIYLQAERSPMPQLRYVVLGTQGRIVYGANFREALAKLVGEAPAAAASAAGDTPRAAPGTTAGTAPSRSTPSPTGRAPASPPGTQSAQGTQQLIDRAAQDLEAYQRLTAEGKYSEAGQRLESLKRTLEQLRQRGQLGTNR